MLSRLFYPHGLVLCVFFWEYDRNNSVVEGGGLAVYCH